MRGHAPKDPALRQRRNRSTSRADLVTSQAPPAKPSLPDGFEWDPLTRAWWDEVWASPMADQYLKADVPGLWMLARLVDRYWAKPSPTLAAEIRMGRQDYGLSPLSRRRLEWAVQRVEPTAKPPPARRLRDPRKALRIVNGDIA